ncbi:MAG TPA: hypothetical protein VI874_00750, partial [Candidatus Norongarragalinales archaeon]|nr:hypothetical protein [Candidatus Norongarragalinales archaeon]
MSEELESMEESSGGLSAILEPIKKFGIGKLILILLVFGALAWFFVLAPKPAKLTLIIQEIDSSGDQGIAGALVAVEIPGQKEQTIFTNENGVATFKDLPSKVKISVRVDPPESFDPASKDVNMESGTDQTVLLELGRATKLSITSRLKE